jgi:hypothetical protein
MHSLKLTFKAVESNGWPKLLFLINDDLIEDYHFNNELGEVIIPIDLLDGNHILSIELYDKTGSQYVELLDMYVDNILLPNMYKWLGIYKFNDQEYPQALRWECNGSWNFNFQTPLVTWMLDVKIANEEKYTTPDRTFEERMIAEQIRIKFFEEQLSKI